MNPIRFVAVSLVVSALLSSALLHAQPKALGIKPIVEWHANEQFVTSSCDSSKTVRTFLVNAGTAYVLIDSIGIVGPTESEWTISHTQNPGMRAFVLDVNDSVWFDMTFSALQNFDCKGVDSLIAYNLDTKVNPVAMLYGNTTSGIAHATLPSQVALSPNPIRDDLRITNSDAKEYRIEVLDILGNRQMVLQSQAPNITVDMRVLPSGVYFVRLSQDQAIVTRRVVKE
jgi:hypothetical protein